MCVYVTTLILLHTDLTSDEQGVSPDDAPLFRVSTRDLLHGCGAEGRGLSGKLTPNSTRETRIVSLIRRE